MILAATLLVALPAQDPQPLAKVLDQALAEVMERHRLPGLAVGLVQGGEVVYARGFGEKVRGGGEPITTRSIFHMASVSKPFTATAAMQLVEAGKLDLDARLTEYLPYYTLADASSREVTVRQVLTHTSGIPDVRDYEWDAPQVDEGAAERYVRGLTGERMLFDPGQGSRYSNMAFDIMGDVIAKVSGMSFDDYVRTHILEPLGMESSSFIHSETPEELRTQGHSLAWSDRIDQSPCPVYPYNRRHAPSSTLNSNVEDMCRWALANLRRGELDGARILQEASYEEMWSRGDDTPGIGLSWVLGSFAGRPEVNHSGGDTGYNSFLCLLPEDDLAVVAMVNSDMSPVGAIARAVLLAALGEPFTMPDARISFEFAHVLESDGADVATERFFELLETEPDRWSFAFSELKAVADALLAKDRPAEAAAVAALATDVYYDNSAAYTLLGRALAQAGDAEGAREAYGQALELSPDDVVARRGLEALGG